MKPYLTKLASQIEKAKKSMLSHINFRPIQDGDHPFLERVYASTREAEMAIVPWTDAEKEAFLQMQFSAQHQYYQEQYTTAHFWVIESQNIPVGRLYLDYRAKEIRIIDITLLNAYRNQGIGTKILQDILTEGQKRNLPVTIHVERQNPALNFYHRLGFHKISDKGVYFLMEWLPEIRSLSA